MKVIVTGGCGFIGSHIVDILIKNNIEVIVIDNLSTGRIENIIQHKNNRYFKFINKDITKYKEIEEYFKNVDKVFHLAGLADIIPSIEKPYEYHNTNVNGTLNILQLCVKYNCKKIIYAASSSCYGIPEIFPTKEDHKIQPMYPYALTKYIGEQYIIHWAKVYKLPFISLRLFNIYGLRSRTTGAYGAVLGVFLKQKLEKKPFTIVGDGNQTRDFTNVKDVANAFYKACISETKNEIFNIGSGGTYSINKLTELLKGEKIYIPKRPGEPDCTFADISKAKKILKWTPKISFEEGIKEVLDNINLWKDASLWDKTSIKKATNMWFKYLGN